MAATLTVKPRGDYINGRFARPRRADGVIPSVDPGDCDEIVGEFPVHRGAPAEALAAARAAFPAWAALPVAARVAALQKLRAELRNRHEDLVATLSAETGRPLWETQGEVRTMYGVLDGVLHNGLAELELRHPATGVSHVEFRPLGVIVVLSPYPQPALLLHADTIAALAAGCTVVAKPSDLAPASGQLYAEIVHEADLPRGVFNLLQGGAATGAALAASPDADGVLFCGSEVNGRQLLAQLAGDASKMVRLLLSGHAAALVLDDANLDEAAYRIVIGACTGTGQRCTSTRRVIAHRRILDPLAQRLIHLLQRVRIGYSTDADTFIGPLIHPRVVDEYLACLARIAEAGGQELVHGGPLSASRHGFYVTPSLHQVSAEALATLGQREAIGPALTLATVGDLDEGVALINSSPLGLVSSVFCRSERSLIQARQSIGSGLCLHNLPTTKWPTKLPVTPRGRSGNSVPCGTLTPRTCTRLFAGSGSEAAFDPTMLPPGLPRDLPSG
jgi:succinylglutamic semialdehyde dehydrogenase